MLLLWDSLKDSTVCPACATAGQMTLHARYEKYHLTVRIAIQRVRCQACATTHALIPEFSVPCTSQGRQEAERCLRARAEGASRSVAAAELLGIGWEMRVGMRLEQELATAVERGKAIWPQAADTALGTWGWIEAVCGSADEPILRMNHFALEHGVNAICFCRASILLFPAGIRRRMPSHKPAATSGPTAPISS